MTEIPDVLEESQYLRCLSLVPVEADPETTSGAGGLFERFRECWYEVAGGYREGKKANKMCVVKPATTVGTGAQSSKQTLRDCAKHTGELLYTKAKKLGYLYINF